MKHEKQFAVRAGVFAAGLAAGFGVALMVGAGSASSDPMGEWTASLVRHGDFAALYQYQTIDGTLKLVDVAYVREDMEQFLRAEHEQFEQQFGAEDQRTRAAYSRLQQFWGP